MTEVRLFLYLILSVLSAILMLQPTSGFTDTLDVAAILDLYVSLNYPSQLKGWTLYGGDPCQESWTGVACFGSSVIYLKLNGLNLSGSLGSQLHNLQNLKQLDLSSNHITGGIPYNLPPNATHLDLAFNQFSQSIPHSLPSLKNLRHLNLSHNYLSGPLGDVFIGLNNLRELDLSYNNFIGDLPSSFEFLSNLTGLFLQNNSFTGAVTLLASLPLIYLDIQDNQFSGVIPRSFQNIPDLWFGGNHFDGAGSPPWDLPQPVAKNISSPPTTQSSALENRPSLKLHGHKKKQLGPGEIVYFVGGGSLVVACAALVILIRVHQAPGHTLEGLSMELSNMSSLESPPVQTPREENPENHSSPVETRLSTSFMPHVQSNAAIKMSIRKSFSENQLMLGSVKIYALEQLQLATNGFSEEKLIGEGSLGSVYRADFADGQSLAVKVILMATLSLTEEEEFFEVICTVHRLRHPNIVPLVGYCMDHRQHILIYEYVRSLTLEEVLHSRRYKPLSWSTRLQIAVEIARALDYLHNGLSPPVAHGNLKAGNILLDEELQTRISDCGLVVLRPLTSNSVKLKASEMAIGDSGYIRPDDEKPGIERMKRDIYAYGVLLLELLTSRRPFDDLLPGNEKFLVKWALLRLHDRESLVEMVDPAIRGTASPRSLSRIADIISFCLQAEGESQQSISCFVERLEFLQERARAAEERNEFEPNYRSFRSTNTFFYGSPTLSQVSFQ